MTFDAAPSDPIKWTVPARIVKWNADESFVPPNATEWFSHSLLEKWNTMMPAGAAFRSQEEVFHTTTMTHSLHCLVSTLRSLASNSPARPHGKED